MTWIRGVAAIAMVCLLVSGCQEPGTSAPSVPPSAADAGGRTRHITRDEYNALNKSTAAWPLTVEGGTLSCELVPGEGSTLHSVVFTTDDGTQYGVNGAAGDLERYREIHDIWAPGVGSALRDITGLIAMGTQLCPDASTTS
ncbi:hypothetical protein ASG95_16135 [Phycicoccus sp. Soil803]|nr:hypothetical protein ASG95_16135 [Phycicoccus sp. Soil803]